MVLTTIPEVPEVPENHRITSLSVVSRNNPRNIMASLENITGRSWKYTGSKFYLNNGDVASRQNVYRGMVGKDLQTDEVVDRLSWNVSSLQMKVKRSPKKNNKNGKDSGSDQDDVDESGRKTKESNAKTIDNIIEKLQMLKLGM